MVLLIYNLIDLGWRNPIPSQLCNIMLVLRILFKTISPLMHYYIVLNSEGDDEENDPNFINQRRTYLDDLDAGYKARVCTLNKAT